MDIQLSSKDILPNYHSFKDLSCFLEDINSRDPIRTGRKPKIIGKDVIGFDETHNGFGINRHYGTHLPLIITGYLIKDYKGSHYREAHFAGKGGVFGPKSKRSLDEIEKRALGYVNSHTDFFYSKITEEQGIKEPEIYLRAKSIVSISLKFLLSKNYKLNEKDLFVCIDGFNDRTHVSFLDQQLEILFNEAGLFLPEFLKDENENICKINNFKKHVYFQKKADRYNVASRCADRVGFQVLALKFKNPRGNPEKRWPFQSRVVDHRRFMDLVYEFKGLNESEED